ARGEVLVQVAHRGSPLFDEGNVRGVHRLLPFDQPIREAFERAHEHLLHRAEVVVHEPGVGPRLLRQAPCRDARIAELDEQSPAGSRTSCARAGPPSRSWKSTKKSRSTSIPPSGRQLIFTSQERSSG